MLQAGYERGTKDSDILETAALIGPVGEKLLSLAGKNSDLNKRYGIYLSIISGHGKVNFYMNKIEDKYEEIKFDGTIVDIKISTDVPLNTREGSPNDLF